MKSGLNLFLLPSYGLDGALWCDSWARGWAGWPQTKSVSQRRIWSKVQWLQMWVLHKHAQCLCERFVYHVNVWKRWSSRPDEICRDWWEEKKKTAPLVFCFLFYIQYTVLENVNSVNGKPHRIFIFFFILTQQSECILYHLNVEEIKPQLLKSLGCKKNKKEYFGEGFSGLAPQFSHLTCRADRVSINLWLLAFLLPFFHFYAPQQSFIAEKSFPSTARSQKDGKRNLLDLITIWLILVNVSNTMCTSAGCNVRPWSHKCLFGLSTTAPSSFFDQN